MIHVQLVFEGMEPIVRKEPREGCPFGLGWHYFLHTESYGRHTDLPSHPQEIQLTCQHCGAVRYTFIYWRIVPEVHNVIQFPFHCKDGLERAID